MSNKMKIGLTSLAIAVSCAGVIYIILKRKVQDATTAFNYLTIKVINTEDECDEVIHDLRRRCKKHRAIGFDCEWVSEKGQQQPVALLQLSTYDGFCGLFRLNILKTVPQSLQDILEDESIYKLGVAPADDAKYLIRDYCIDPKSILDIRHIVQICGHKTGGLAALSKNHLGIVLDKSWRIRCSDWEAKELSEKQIRYAAADAHVAIKIFVKLLNEYGNTGFLGILRRNNSNPIWNNLDEFCEKYVEIRFKSSQKKGLNNNMTVKDRESENKKNSTAVRKKPLYHNCFLQAPDGEVLCTCDYKKAFWYIEKGLAEMVIDDPLTVRLVFEPAGRSVGDVGRYYQLTKDNKCVVCGSTNSYIRKNVVPREYRKYFPEIMKDHSSHDVVLLCSSCHQQSNMKDLSLRLQLAESCAAPFSCQGQNTKYFENPEYKLIRSAARALLYQAKKHVLPDARRKKLEHILLQHYPQHEEITQELLEEAATVEVNYENDNYECHGEKVVEHFLLLEEGLLGLEKLWRQHFLNTMKPKYMPKLWSIKHTEERLRVKFEEGRLSENDMKLIGMTKWLK